MRMSAATSGKSVPFPPPPATGGGDEGEKSTTKRKLAISSTSALGSKLQLQCADGKVFHVTHEEAMMSSTLWMLLQDVSGQKGKSMVKQHTVPIFDVPSGSVELALAYCRLAWSLYKQQVEGKDTALYEWEERFFELDSKTLCDLAKVASNLDIQPLVDLTCRSIAQIMSATEAADEIRHKFGLEESHGSIECNCEFRTGMAGFDFGMFNSLDHDLPTEEYELVEFDQPSVDELVSYINGSGNNPIATTSQHQQHGAGSSGCHVHGSEGSSEHITGTGTGKKKSKKKKKRNKKPASASQQNTTDVDLTSPIKLQTGDGVAGSHHGKNNGDSKSEDEEEGNDTDEDKSDVFLQQTLKTQDLREKVRLARQNPSAIFQESLFEDDYDEETEEQIESFRLALESAHLDSKKKTLKPRLTFTPQDVFRSTLVASQRESGQRLSATIT